MTDTCRGGGDRSGRGLGRRIKYGRLAAGADSADGVVDFGAPLNCKWDRVKGKGMEGLPLTELRHQAT